MLLPAVALLGVVPVYISLQQSDEKCLQNRLLVFFLREGMTRSTNGRFGHNPKGATRGNLSRAREHRLGRGRRCHRAEPNHESTASEKRFLQGVYSLNSRRHPLH
jgi:hypothetical protein